MKPSNILFQVASATLKLTVTKDLRFRRHGRGRGLDQWTFPYASLSAALKAVEKEQKEHPRHKWTTTVDKTA